MQPIVILMEHSPSVPMPNRQRLWEKLTQAKSLSKQQIRLMSAHGNTGYKMIVSDQVFAKLKAVKSEMNPLIKRNKDHIFVTFRDVREYFGLLPMFDLFVFELFSVLDFLSREINIVMELDLPEKSIGIWNVKQKLMGMHSDDPIAQELNILFREKWFQYFRKMRNRITHRLGIFLFFTADTLETYLPDQPFQDIQDILEDDSCDQKREVIEHCQCWLLHMFKFVEKISELMGKKIFKDW